MFWYIKVVFTSLSLLDIVKQFTQYNTCKDTVKQFLQVYFSVHCKTIYTR